MYKEFDFEYDSRFFLEIFEKNLKDEAVRAFSKTQYDIHQESYIDKFYQKFKFIPRDRRSIEILEVRERVGPYISPGNNGTILFPLRGELEYNFYSYVPETIENNRPILKPGTANKDVVYPTLLETIKINKPTAINGLVTHMYRPLISPAIIFVLKIPMIVSWDQVIQGI